VVITEDTKALQCDRCQRSETWKCVDCLAISDDMYDKLVSEAGRSVRWFCDQCENAVMQKPCIAECHSDKFDQLISTIEKLVDKYASVERRLADKCDVEKVDEIEARINGLEEKMLRLEGDLAQRDQCISSPIEKRLCALESGLTNAAGSIDRKFDHGVPDEDIIKCAVEEEVKRKQKRRRNWRQGKTMS